jgi:hypothetical protein
MVQGWPRQKCETLSSQKYLKIKRARDVTQVEVVEHLLSKLEALSTNPSTTKIIIMKSAFCKHLLENTASFILIELPNSDLLLFQFCTCPVIFFAC